MDALVKICSNFKEVEKNKEIREKEFENLGKYITPELKEDYKYKPCLFNLDDIVRAYISEDDKDLYIFFKDGDSFCVKFEESLWDILVSKF